MAGQSLNMNTLVINLYNSQQGHVAMGSTQVNSGSCAQHNFGHRLDLFLSSFAL